MRIEIDSLSVRYSRGRQHVFALRDVSLNLNEGETVGLIGESGSGKTTLGRTIVGLERAHAGSILFEGRQLVGLSERAYRKVRREIAMIFQDPLASLSPRRTVFENLIEPFRVHGIERGSAKRRVVDLLNDVGLEEMLLTAYPHELSGGQGRRVAIARAMTLEPRVIIADEPTAGLDVSVQGDIVNLLRRLQTERKASCLFITHNLAVARHIADSLAVLYRGWLCETGPINRVLETPAHPYTQLLLRATPPVDLLQKRQGARRSFESTAARTNIGCPFSAICDRAEKVCRVERPPTIDVGAGQLTRCHFPLR